MCRALGFWFTAAASGITILGLLYAAKSRETLQLANTSSLAIQTPWVFTPTAPWHAPPWDPSEGVQAPLDDGTIPGNPVRLNMHYRGSLLGYNNYDYVAWRNRSLEWADVEYGSEASIFVLDDLLDAREIRQLVHAATDRGWGPPHNKHGQLVEDAYIRNDLAATIDSSELAAVLWQRIELFFPEFRHFGERGSLNPRLRFSKYAPGGQFRCHYDGQYVDPNDPLNASRYSLLVYLADVHHGGETRFLNGIKGLTMDIPPRTGRAVIFDYNAMHCGLMVREGEKIVMKADVMVEHQRAKMPPGGLD
ncbi:hypothetical protein HKX48_006363 [Thoreauomyces humboldtii]|nr:hypothetical protein HKX48_006363 [Thoreauomyces humboldtii]